MIILTAWSFSFGIKTATLELQAGSQDPTPGGARRVGAGHLPALLLAAAGSGWGFPGCPRHLRVGRPHKVGPQGTHQVYPSTLVN